MLQNNKGFTPLGQLGILLAMGGAGLIIGSVLSVALFMMSGVDLTAMEKAMTDPSKANLLKAIQFVSTFASLFLPAVAFSFLCFRRGWEVLGFRSRVVWQIAAISVLIILSAGPLIDALTTLNKAIPISKGMKAYFDNMETKYEEQIKVLGAVNSFPQYLLSLVIIALQPAVFEEILFRGALQGILQRWFRHGLVAVVVTGFLFSIIHFSWYGLLPRWALGILLGLIYLYTGNIWYSIIVHFLNNAIVVTFMYVNTMQGKALPTGTETVFPAWAGVISMVVIYFLLGWLRKTVAAHQVDVSSGDITTPSDDYPTPPSNIYGNSA